MISVGFRFRYLLGVLCHAVVALVGCASPSWKGAEILARCGGAPSFADQTELKRWASFPVDVYVDLDSLPRAGRRDYREGIERGVALWSEATSGRIGSFRIRYDRPGAPVRIRLVSSPLPDGAVASTELTFTASRIVAATVHLTPSRFGSGALLARDVASTTAHEMGHVLGIIDHSPYPEDKMWVSGNFDALGRTIDPGALLTARDVNTIEEAYCRPFEQLAATHGRERRAQTERGSP